MSRIANSPVVVPSGVEVKLQGNNLSVSGSKGSLNMVVHKSVAVKTEDGELQFSGKDRASITMAGTMRALANNMVIGVSQGFERKLLLQGVGYRAQAQGRTLNLQLGFSHPISYQLPDGIEVQTPSQTEIVVTGTDKQKVGQVSADIRRYRPPEPYKGKGVRYAHEHVRRKEAKKK
ncbi:MAG: 50S ribosomal protein L6 [Proteobacteria bacterium]|nr:50S ribosomal protein L6 [Pseudomonadota bacterium]